MCIRDSYEGFPDNPTANDVKPILDTVMAQFASSSSQGSSSSMQPDDEEQSNIPKNVRMMVKRSQNDDNDNIPEFVKDEMSNTASGADEVVVLFTDFVSSITQVASAQTILPAAFEPAESPEDLPSTEGKEEVPIEPDPRTVVDIITPRLVEVQLFQAILESQASEHVSRMLAMKNASDNAGDLIDDLTLEFNSARQAAITQELAEISAGTEAIS